MNGIIRNCMLLAALVFLGMVAQTQAQDVYLWNDSMLYQDEDPWELAGWGNLTASYDVQFYYDTTINVYLMDQPFHYLDIESGSTSVEVLADVDPGASYHIISELFVNAFYVGLCYPDEYYDIFGFWWYGGESYGDWWYDFVMRGPDICVSEASLYVGNLILDVDTPPWIDFFAPSRQPQGVSANVNIYGAGFGQNPSVNVAGSGITVSILGSTNGWINTTFNIAADATLGNHAVTVTNSSTGATSHGKDFFVQIPSSLSIVQGTDSTTPEAICGSGQCGTVRTFTYQVYDQQGQPIDASLSMWDEIHTTSPDYLQFYWNGTDHYNTTCSAFGKPNGGPCGVSTYPYGGFGETLGSCSPACCSSGSCITGGPTNATQTWHIGTGQIVKSLSYYCDHVVIQ